jgi:hypothetical protein
MVSLLFTIGALIPVVALFRFARRTWGLATRDAPDWAPPPEIVAEGGPFRATLVELHATARVPRWIVASSTLGFVIGLAAATHAYWNSRACDLYRSYSRTYSHVCAAQSLTFLRSMSVSAEGVVAAALLLAAAAWLLPRRGPVRWRIVRGLTTASCGLAAAALGAAVTVPGEFWDPSLRECLLKEFEGDPRTGLLVNPPWYDSAASDLWYQSVVVALVVFAIGAWIRYQARENAPFGRRRNADVVRAVPRGGG